LSPAENKLGSLFASINGKIFLAFFGEVDFDSSLRITGHFSPSVLGPLGSSECMSQLYGIEGIRLYEMLGHAESDLSP
jgi:hypothetical protein